MFKVILGALAISAGLAEELRPRVYNQQGPSCAYSTPYNTVSCGVTSDNINGLPIQTYCSPDGFCGNNGAACKIVATDPTNPNIQRDANDQCFNNCGTETVGSDSTFSICGGPGAVCDPASGFTCAINYDCIPTAPPATEGICTLSVTPSNGSGRRSRRSFLVGSCGVGWTSCPIARGKWGCIDVFSNLEICGGCLPPLGRGQDCTAIEGAKSVACVDGKCQATY